MKSLIIFTGFLSVAFASVLYHEIFQANPENFVELIGSRIFSRYMDPTWTTKQAESDTILSNLNEKTQQLPNCLNHIINYNGMNLGPFTTPIVVSRYDVIHVKYRIQQRHRKENQTSKYTVWKRVFPFETATQIHNNETLPVKWCMRKAIRYDSECFDIPFIDNSPKAKPWSCESNWYLFPPSQKEDPLFYENSAWETEPLRMIIPASYKKFWSHDLHRINNETDTNVRWNYPAKTRPIFDIIVTKLRREDFPTMKAWTESLNIPYNGWTYQYTTVAREELTFELVKLDQNGEIYALGSTVLFCRNCKRFQTFQLAPIDKPFSLKNLKESFVELNSNTDNIHWGVGLVGEFDAAFFSQDDEELLQSPYSLLLKKGLDYKRRWVRLEKVQYSFEIRLLMQIIVGNGSFENVNWWSFNFKSLKEPISTETRRMRPGVFITMAGKEEHFPFRFHPQKLKFVSCGSAGKKQLAFEQLSSIFDTSIWTCIACSTILFTSFCCFVHYSKLQNSKVETTTCWKLLSHFILEYALTAKALCEQGDPISSKYIKLPCLRCAAGPYLLMLLVLTNAYKNKNIEEITLPRAPIPFDSFDALTQYSFKIYTRLISRFGNKETTGLQKMLVFSPIEFFSKKSK